MSLLNRIVKSNGQEIGPSSIVSLTYTETVNSGSNLEPGCVSVASLDIVYRQGVSLAYGDEFTYYVHDSESGKDTLIGTFIAEKPSRESTTTYSVLAYDKLSKSEKDLSSWLNSIQDQFPIQLYAFAQQVCEQCGLSLANLELLNGDHMVRQFYADGITGRQLLSWIAQASATFCHCTPSGRVSFEWYAQVQGTYIRPGFDSARATVRLAGETLRTNAYRVYRVGVNSIGYFSDSLQYEDYISEAPVKVQIRRSDTDVGVIYPPDEESTNALVIQNNMLLVAETPDELNGVAENIFNVVRGLSFTPFSVELPMTTAFRAGSIITIQNATGHSFSSPVQSCSWSSGRLTLTSTGDPTRDSSRAVNSKTYENLDGKLLNINANVDGLTVTSVKKGEVRSEFALDDSSVRINTGLISFESNSIEIESDNFKLTPEGDVSAAGVFTSHDGNQKSSVRSGGVFTYSGDALCTAIQKFSDDTEAMGAVVCYGPVSGGGRHVEAVMRATAYGGAIGLTDNTGRQVVQIANGIVQAEGLGITGEKNRIVDTSFGKLKFHAIESPRPCFQDFGSGTCGQDGICTITMDPRFEDAVSAGVMPTWMVTATSPGQMWVENGFTAIVHGEPGQTFNWSVTAPQRGYENQYADPWVFPGDTEGGTNEED